MATAPRRRPAPRRRRDDEGEDEIGDLEDDSMSDESGLSLDGEDEGDAEASDHSQDEGQRDNTVMQKVSTSDAPAVDQLHQSNGSRSAPAFATSADTEAMMNGLRVTDGREAEQELNLDGSVSDDALVRPDKESAKLEVPVAPRHETLAQKARREHQEYLKQRDSNPAFVPNRGGFFLHDDRSTSGPAFWNRPYGRGRGRGFQGAQPEVRGPPPVESLDRQWAHDLHEKHESIKAASLPRPVVQAAPKENRVLGSSRLEAPNREFSFSTTLGSVTVHVELPGSQRKAVPGLVKKQHTLLPTHRPPLRRDKPVRISIPAVEPSYRFPSTERSFIFIPRALRPNQQGYMRGRGRGSFHGSRRPSIFGGSAYTPSAAMSRRSSFGLRDTRSPASSTYGRPSIPTMEVPRPVVRMPSDAGLPPSTGLVPSAELGYPQASHLNGSVSYGVHSTAIPMHQPRPQKAVSVTNIESPAALSVKAPQQQQEQPFHQQMAACLPQNGPDGSLPQQTGLNSGAAGTPLSHIPEGAIHAQPFQPYPMMAGPMYYPSAYGNGGMYYPTMQGASQGYGAVWLSNNMYQTMGSNAQQQSQASQQAMSHSMPMVQEPNGMMYYPDMSQTGQGHYQTTSQPGMMLMGGYGYYPMPNPMFYQTQP